MGFDKLIANGAFKAVYPLHDGPFKVRQPCRPGCEAGQSLSKHGDLQKEDGDGYEDDGRGNDRATLFQYWGRLGAFYFFQPYDTVQRYLGGGFRLWLLRRALLIVFPEHTIIAGWVGVAVKIGLYFAWLGFYTLALLVPSFLGIVVFMIGIATVEDHAARNSFLRCLPSVVRPLLHPFPTRRSPGPIGCQGALRQQQDHVCPL
jgi:hypothetical protein